jgi:glycerol-3-phosphate acyltransferase PlsX
VVAIDSSGGDDPREVLLGLAEWSFKEIPYLEVESAAEGVRALLDGRAQAFVSAGNTKEVVRAATRLGRIKFQPPGFDRPRGIKLPIALELPTEMDEKHFVLCDAGGSVDVDEYDLVTFAHAGATYFRELEFNPHLRVRVGILAIGEGEEKLRRIDRECLELLKNVDSFELVGGVESYQVLAGEVDVLIGSGREGNLALKGVEAGVVMEHTILRQEFARGFGSRLTGFAVKLIGHRAFARAKARLNESRFAGGILCGFEHENAAIFICHGRSSADDIYDALDRAYRWGDAAARMQATLKEELHKYHPDWFSSLATGAPHAP